MMKVLVFDLRGKFAHYRVFYANANALTYTFPPKTAIMGTLAAILGIKRDEYYETLETLRIGVRSVVPVRKRIFEVNYVRTKREDVAHLRFRMNETYQARLEILIAKTDDFLSFRIYIGGHGKLYERIKNHLEEGNFYYSPYLGISEFLGWIDYKGEYEAKEQPSKRIDSVIPSDYMDILDLSGSSNLYVERMPTGFKVEDGIRKIRGIKDFINANGKPIHLSEEVKVVSIRDLEENILWM